MKKYIGIFNWVKNARCGQMVKRIIKGFYNE